MIRAIATAVYRRVRRYDVDHWTSGVIRRTAKPMITVLVTLILLGIAIPLIVPGADQVGDLYRAWQAASP